MQGGYVLVCKGDKWLIPLACNQVIISFSWRTNLQMFIGSIKHDVTITKIKLSCVSFAPHSRIFLVGGSSISTASTTVRNWTASLKFHGLELPRKCRCHGKAFLSLTQSSQTRVPHEDMQLTSLCFLVFLLRLRAVSYYSLQSYCTRNPSTRAAINEGVSSRRKVPIPYCYITSWFAIALAEIRTRRIKREKADCKQSILASFLDWISLSVTLVISRPESSLSVNMLVDRKILGAKIEILNCLLVVCTR